MSLELVVVVGDVGVGVVGVVGVVGEVVVVEAVVVVEGGCFGVTDVRTALVCKVGLDGGVVDTGSILILVS